MIEGLCYEHKVFKRQGTKNVGIIKVAWERGEGKGRSEIVTPRELK